MNDNNKTTRVSRPHDSNNPQIYTYEIKASEVKAGDEIVKTIHGKRRRIFLHGPSEDDLQGREALEVSTEVIDGTTYIKMVFERSPEESGWRAAPDDPVFVRDRDAEQQAKRSR